MLPITFAIAVTALAIAIYALVLIDAVIKNNRKLAEALEKDSAERVEAFNKRMEGLKNEH
jgi:uncharacterized protein YoxC